MNVFTIQVEFQKLFVERYSNKCDGDFPSLEDDGYVYQKLLYHIADSGNEP